ncbi:hypothetical protein E2C01_057785 [Portunus trituberculatus]|uniref:Uncharacterized protein n=1 Tax=Portunus trituberculatus TaxID=210409 RepID=A0A5B7H0Y1_PORTR|nr:hypothetical protein [Portunus trituberculatus]
MDVNARSYRWSESRSKVNQMCDLDETMEHVMLECVKYARDIYEMMQVVLTELGIIGTKEWKRRGGSG